MRREREREKKRSRVGEVGGGEWGVEETVIISSLSCESQPVLPSLPGKLEIHTKSLYSNSEPPEGNRTIWAQP